MTPTGTDTPAEGAAPAGDGTAATTRMDPRIRARRIAVLRGVGRRRLHRLGAVGIVAAVVVTAVGLALSPALDVDVVEVSGAARVSEQAVVTASGVRRGDPLVTLDAGAAARGVRRLPWVADVVVERRWPGTVSLTVTEREPVAGVVRPGDTVALVDATGHVLAVVATDRAGVVLIDGGPAPGPPGTTVPAELRPALALAGALPEEVRPRTGRILVGDGGLRLELLVEGQDEPAVALLGDDRELGAKMTALATVLASVDLTGLAVLDLEVPDVPALTRR